MVSLGLVGPVEAQCARGAVNCTNNQVLFLAWQTPIFGTFGIAGIDEGDGLTVELMGFAIEGEDEPAP